MLLTEDLEEDKHSYEDLNFIEDCLSNVPWISTRAVG